MVDLKRVYLYSKEKNSWGFVFCLVVCLQNISARVCHVILWGLGRYFCCTKSFRFGRTYMNDFQHFGVQKDCVVGFGCWTKE